jgi:hypothetical protein
MKKLIKWLVILSIAGLVLLIGPQYINYARGRDAIPAGVTLGGASIGGDSTAEAVANVRAVFERPVLVFHGDNPLVLKAEDIDFEVDAEAMVREAQERAKGWYAIWDFLFYLMDKPPVGIDIPLKYSYDREKLAAWIKKQSQKYDHEPLPPTVNLETLSFGKGRPGVRTDPSQTAIDIVQAFTDAYNREAHFSLISEEGGKPDFSALDSAMRARFEKFPGVYASYFQFLPSGEEIDIDADTAFSGMSTVKLGILVMTYMDNDMPLPDNITKWISITITSPTASNAAANALMYHLGDGDLMKGVRRVSQFYQDFGLKNTFISTPYNSDIVPPMKRTPANTNPEYHTNLDPAMQTTPRDIGILMAEIGRCAEGKGSLLAAYPDKLTPEKCENLIWWLEQNPLGYLIKYGVPEGTKIGHKHGYAPDTQGDVAIIYGPEGPYVLDIYVYQYGWVVWDMSNPLMGDISRLVWNFFLFREGKEQLPPPVYEDDAQKSTDS